MERKSRGQSRKKTVDREPTEPEPYYLSALRAWAEVVAPYHRRARLRRRVRLLFLGPWPDWIGNPTRAVLYVVLLGVLVWTLSLYVPWIPW